MFNVLFLTLILQTNEKADGITSMVISLKKTALFYWENNVWLKKLGVQPQSISFKLLHSITFFFIHGLLDSLTGQKNAFVQGENLSWINPFVL